MTYNLWSWFITKEVTENGLKAAVEQNKAATKETIQSLRRTRSKTQELLKTAEESLSLLDRIEKRKGR